MPTFKIQYNTAWGESLVLATPFKKFPMQWTEGNVWTVKISEAALKGADRYCYLVERDGLTQRMEWEDRPLETGKTRRMVEDSWIDAPDGCPFNRRHTSSNFDKPGFRGAGTAIPVFSLRSAEDFGIGEFRDLHPLVDWAASTGQCIIQLLPVNDTTRKGDWDDSYPYSPVSSFALHPMYIHLQDIGIAETADFKKKQAELNALPELDYPAVFKAKTAYIKEAWRLRGKKDTACKAYRSFTERNAFWLDEYAAFCARRDGDTPEYHRWLQYHLDLQFSEEAAYARSRGVCFKGDLPIGVSADSADAYFHPELFNLDSSAGAPPDFFSANGQNWGFPTYNWEAMAKDGYAWWKRRLIKMSEYFDAFRIDHILGFFRIWEIPAGKNGLDGHFNPSLPYSKKELEEIGLWGPEGLFTKDPRHKGGYVPLITPASGKLPQWQQERFGALYDDFFFHRHDEFWRRNAERKLPELLRVTGMLACGEDLGMIPHCVNGVMEKEGILSLEMPIMEKGRPWPYLAVCTTSSHDMDTLRMQNGESDLPDWECRNRIRGVLEAAPMLAILPLQDWLSIDGEQRRKDYKEERVNQPADPHHHWRYRLHFNLEELKSLSEFNATIEGLLKDSRRYC